MMNPRDPLDYRPTAIKIVMKNFAGANCLGIAGAGNALFKYRRDEGKQR
jgi:hypothetical protein